MRFLYPQQDIDIIAGSISNYTQFAICQRVCVSQRQCLANKALGLPTMQDKEVLPTDEIKRLAALRRQQQAEISKDSNLVQVGVALGPARPAEAPNHGALHALRKPPP